MINTSPVELTGQQWAALLADADTQDVIVSDFDNVENILNFAREALGHRPDGDPLRCPELLEICVWGTGDADNEDLMITVDLPGGLRLATELVRIGTFKAANATPGEPVLRAVLGGLLSYRNRLLADLTAAMKPDGIVLTRDQLENWTGEPLTPEDLARLNQAIPDSSIPDSVGDISAAFRKY